MIQNAVIPEKATKPIRFRTLSQKLQKRKKFSNQAARALSFLERNVSANQIFLACCSLKLMNFSTHERQLSCYLAEHISNGTHPYLRLTTLFYSTNTPFHLPSLTLISFHLHPVSTPTPPHISHPIHIQ